MTEAKNSTTKSAPNMFDVEAATDRVRVLNQKVLVAAKQSGNLSLDAYEKTVHSLLDFEEKVAGASQLEWVSSVANAHVSFVTEISDAYTKAVREALK